MSMDSHPHRAQSLSKQWGRRRLTPLHERLRIASAALHDIAEKHNPFYGPDLNNLRYGYLMAHLEVLWRGLEEALAGFECRWEALGLSTERFFRLARLHADLQILRPTLYVPKEKLHVPSAIATEWPAALGCLYVLVGSRLGGQMIARRLKRHLTGPSQKAVSFWESQASLARNDLLQLLQVIEAQHFDEDSLDKLVCGAQHTFVLWNQWMTCAQHNVKEQHY